MAFAHADFLRVADSLLNTTSGAHDEAYRRSAVSRAYYAAFGVARKYAKANLGLVLSNTAADHKAVAQILFDSGDVDMLAAANNLKRLRRERNDADYDIGIAVSQKAATESLTVAQQVVDALA